MWVGNDVVDLNGPGVSGRSRDRRFMDRVFSAAEQDRILGSADPDGMLWALWAAKEAAYKAALKADHDVVFAHREFLVEGAAPGKSGEPASGRVTHGSDRYRVKWQRGKGWVHCLAVGPLADGGTERGHEPCFEVRSGTRPGARPTLDLIERLSVYSPASVAVRVLAKEMLAAKLALNSGEVRIVRAPLGGGAFGPPFAMGSDGNPIDVDLSLSHDGPWVAAAAMV